MYYSMHTYATVHANTSPSTFRYSLEVQCIYFIISTHVYQLKYLKRYKLIAAIFVLLGTMISTLNRSNVKVKRALESSLGVPFSIE